MSLLKLSIVSTHFFKEESPKQHENLLISFVIVAFMHTVIGVRLDQALDLETSSEL